jgi:predicted RNA binding protein YcfA (HicA-like mRNA interferase family)
MNLSPKFLIKLLEEKGFIYKRSKGSHMIYYNPIDNKMVVVPFHNGKDMKKGTFLSILKQADIKL